MSLRYFMRETNADATCDASPVPRDLALGASGAGGAVNGSTSSTTFVEVITFDVEAFRQNPQGGAFPFSLDLSLMAANAELKMRVVAVDPACAALAASDYSATFNAVGIYTGTVTLASWPAGARRLRVSVEAKSTDGLSAAVRVRAGGSSYLDAPFEPRLRTLADDVLARVQAITVAAGYHSTVGETARGRRFPGEATAYPAVYVWSVGFFDRRSVLASDGPLQKEVIAAIELRMHILQTDPQTDLELLAADIVRAVEGDPVNLGHPEYVISVNAARFEQADTDPAIQAGLGSGSLFLEIAYRTGRGAI